MNVSMSPWGLIILPVAFLLLLKWPKQHGTILEDTRVSLIRRVAAFYIDVSVAMIGVIPLTTMPILVVEYLTMGEWQWSFDRDFFRDTDWIFVVCLLASFYGIFYYFKWHFDKRKQTVGQHLLKFMLVPLHDHPSLGVRFFVAWVCAAWWPFWPWTIFKLRQDYFWDTASGIRARRVSSS
jgi:RDD family